MALLTDNYKIVGRTASGATYTGEPMHRPSMSAAFALSFLSMAHAPRIPRPVMLSAPPQARRHRKFKGYQRNARNR